MYVCIYIRVTNKMENAMTYFGEVTLDNPDNPDNPDSPNSPHVYFKIYINKYIYIGRDCLGRLFQYFTKIFHRIPPYRTRSGKITL